MAWTWRYLNEAAEEFEPAGYPPQTFPSQGDAESWVGEVWRDLAGAGVDAVLLLEEDRVVYGPMSLSPPA